MAGKDDAKQQRHCHDVLNPKTIGTKHLLTIPSADVIHDSKAVEINGNAADDDIVLLQVPQSWNKNDDAIIEKLQQEKCCFMASKTSVASDAGAAISANNSAVVSFVTNTQSYTVHRVETSNTLVLIPPSTASSTGDSNKRIQLDDGSTAAKSTSPSSIVQCQLLKTKTAASKATTNVAKNNSSTASFLELREMQFHISDLVSLFYAKNQQYIYDPYAANLDGTIAGISCTEIMNVLHLSKRQIVDALQQQLHAYKLPPNSAIDATSGNEARYVLLSEESLQECYNAILATLLEEPDICNEYGGVGILLPSSETQSLQEFVQAYVVQRMCEEDRFQNDVYVLMHCLRLLQKVPTTTSDVPLQQQQRFALCKTKVNRHSSLLRTLSCFRFLVHISQHIFYFSLPLVYP